MKYIIILLLAISVFGCAKKITAPATPAIIQPAPEPPKAVIKSESPAAIAGKNIYTTKCAVCHEAKPLADWTVQEWVPIIDRMAPKAALNEAQKADLKAYINAHAKS